MNHAQQKLYDVLRETPPAEKDTPGYCGSAVSRAWNLGRNGHKWRDVMAPRSSLAYAAWVAGRDAACDKLAKGDA